MPSRSKSPAIKLMNADEFFAILSDGNEEAILEQLHAGFDLNKHFVGLSFFQHLLPFNYPRVTEFVTQEISEGKVYSLSRKSGKNLHPPLGMAHPANHALLLQMGEDINGCGDAGHPPLLYACARFGDFQPPTALKKIKSLLALGADPHGTGKDGYTALMALASLRNDVIETNEYKEAFDVLIKAGCNVQRRTLKGLNALIEALSSSLPAVMMLLERGATFDENSGQIESAAKLAIGMDDTRALERLKAHGLDPIRSSADLFFHAFLCDSPSALVWLMDEGCDPHAKNVKGQTVFDLKPANESCRIVARSWLARKEAHLAVSEKCMTEVNGAGKGRSVRASRC